MNSKKAITLLVLATLLLSFVPIMPIKAAVSDLEIWEIDGVPDVEVIDGAVYVYGDTLAVLGNGIAPGQDIEIWWDGSTRLNTTDGNADGSFELWFDVPEALGGDHYLWLKVPSTGDFVKADTNEIAPAGALMVGPRVRVSPSSGLEGETVTVRGYGFSDEEDIVDVTFDGTTVDTTPSEPETDDLGSWEAEIEVPDLVYGTYDVYAIDDLGANALDDFEIGASIELDVEEGPAGTVVEISGRGFTADQIIGVGTVELNGIPCYIIDDDAKVRDNADTTFVMEIVIPDVPGDLDEYELYVEEPAGAGYSATADFELLGHPGVETEPEYGPVGSTIIVRGYNFTAIDGETVLLQLATIGDTEVETDSNGEFEASFRIPGAAGTPMLTAVQDGTGGTEDYGLEAMAAFRVGFITVVVNPQSGPAGTWVSVSGSGFEFDIGWNATIDDDLWLEDTATGAGVITDLAHIPSLDAGVYEVLITEFDSGIQVSAEFEVTAPTSVETSPVVAPPGYEVTMMGYNFAENPVFDTAIEAVLYNDTDEWTIDLDYDGDTTELLLDEDWDDGYFEGDFMLPGEDDIDVGMYYVNVTDEWGLFYQLMFEIVDKTVDIEPKMPVFQVGDVAGFDVESSFIYHDSYIEIYDPEGGLYWSTDEFDEDLWVNVGTIERVPYYSQVAGGNPMTFLEDAPLGEWSWIWYEDGGDDELDSGVFGLEASDDAMLSDQVTDLSESIADLSNQVSDVSDEYADIKSDIADVASVAADAVAAANAAADAVTAVAATANTAVEAAELAAEAANNAKDAASGLTTLVYGAIGAALVAALAAIVSLMQISRRIAG